MSFKLIELNLFEPLEALLFFPDLFVNIVIHVPQGLLELALFSAAEFRKFLLDIDIVLTKKLSLLAFKLTIEFLLQHLINAFLLGLEVLVQLSLVSLQFLTGLSHQCSDFFVKLGFYGGLLLPKLLNIASSVLQLPLLIPFEPFELHVRALPLRLLILIT